MSGIVALCQGVADALNAGSFSQAFTASFEYAPNYSTMDAKTLRVIVTDAGGDVAMISKGMIGYTDNVRVVILHRVDAGATGIDTSKMAEALDLLEEIVEYLIVLPIDAYMPQGTVSRGTGEKDKQHYMPGNLEDRVFAASIVIPYESKATVRRNGS
jgi:hypothetical protein